LPVIPGRSTPRGAARDAPTKAGWPGA